VHGCLNIRVFATVQTRDQLLGTVAWWYSPFVQIARSAISLQSAWSTTVALIEHSPALEARRTNLASIRDLVLSHEPTAEELADNALEQHLRRPGESGQKTVQRNATIRDRAGLGIEPSIGSNGSGTVAAARLLDPQARAPNHRTRCHSLNNHRFPPGDTEHCHERQAIFLVSAGGVPSNGQESNHRAR
jgi:hypothetical protein